MQSALRIVYPPFVGGRMAVGLLLLRVFAGLALAVHGFGKITDIPGFAENINPPGPEFLHLPLAAAAALSEFVGGIALAAGLLTPVAAFFIGCTMLEAARVHMIVRGDPFMGGWELAGVYLTCAVVVLLTGPGRISIDYLIFGKKVGESAPGA